MRIQAMSHMGQYHTDANGTNEDVVCSGQNNRLCVISLADGVSTCREAKAGADIASKAITHLFLTKGNLIMNLDNGRLADLVFSHVLHELKKQAARMGLAVEDLSCTVTSILIDKKSGKMLCYHLGDSMILAVGNGKCRVLGMPSFSTDGCIVTTTENGQRKACVSWFDARAFESVAIVSDGAWQNMFSKNRLRQDVTTMLIHGDYGTLEEYLASKKCADDYSFISADTREMGRRCA